MATKIATGIAAVLLFVVVIFAQVNLQSAANKKGEATNIVSSISGRIAAGGKPVEAGRLLVYLPDDQILGCIVNDGRYTLRNMPVGEFPVSIEGTTVAENYAWADSGLTISVQETQNKNWDFHVMPLEPKTTTAIGTVVSIAATQNASPPSKSPLHGKAVIIEMDGVIFGVNENIRFETVGQIDYIVVPMQHDVSYDHWMPLDRVRGIKVFDSKESATAHNKKTSAVRTP